MRQTKSTNMIFYSLKQLRDTTDAKETKCKAGQLVLLVSVVIARLGQLNGLILCPSMYAQEENVPINSFASNAMTA